MKKTKRSTEKSINNIWHNELPVATHTDTHTRSRKKNTNKIHDRPRSSVAVHHMYEYTIKLFKWPSSRYVVWAVTLLMMV